MQMLNISIQSSSIELLQAIVSRGEIDHILVESIETTAIAKLYFSVHMNQLDLQNKWLHLLHSVISVSTSLLESTQTTVVKGEENAIEVSNTQERPTESAVRYPMNPLLIQTLVDGISTRSNRPVLQHWLDFVLMAVPQFQPALQAAVTPLNDCLCRQLLFALGEIQGTNSRSQEYAEDITASVTDAELIMLLNALERLILLSLAYTSEPDSSEDDGNIMEKTTSETGGLLGYVSNVFSSDTSSSNQNEQLTVRISSFKTLSDTDNIPSHVLLATGLWTMGFMCFTHFGPRCIGKRQKHKHGHPKTTRCH